MCAIAVAAGHTATAQAPGHASVEAHLDKLRGITPCTSTADCDRVNKQLDAIASEILRQRDVAGPVADEALRSEAGKARPDQFFLLDVGELLLRIDAAKYAGTTVLGLSKLDPESEIIRANFQQLFYLTHRLAMRAQPDLLPFVDRAFLPTKQRMFVPQHALTLDGGMMGVFIYGAWGPGAEDHLTRQLDGSPRTTRVIEILNFLGSEQGVGAVQSALARSATHDTVGRAVGFMMRVGGPAGRRAVLALDASKLDGESKAYLTRIRPDVERYSIGTISSSIARLKDQETFANDQALLAALDRDAAEHGRSFHAHMRAVVESRLPAGTVIGRLKTIRSRMLYRVSDEALHDVELLNWALNAVQYRGAKP